MSCNQPCNQPIKSQCTGPSPEIGAAAAAIVTVLPTSQCYAAIDHGIRSYDSLPALLSSLSNNLKGLLAETGKKKREHNHRIKECIHSLRTLNNWMLTTLTGALYSPSPEQSEQGHKRSAICNLPPSHTCRSKETRRNLACEATGQS